MATLTILGSGASFPTPERWPSSFLLQTETATLLVDCGHSTLARLTEVGIDPRSIDAVFISHFHPDHCGDLFNLVAARFVGDLYQHQPHTPLRVIGPATIAERFATWRTIFWPEPSEDYPVEFIEAPESVTVGDLTLATFPVRHVPWFPSIGLRVADGSETLLAYPGDVGSDQDQAALAAACHGAKLLLVEAGYPEPTPNHFTIEQVKELVRSANIDRAVLVHIRARPGEEERIRAAISDQPSLSIGADRQVITI